MEYILNYYLYREIQDQIKERKRVLRKECRENWAKKFTGLAEYPDFEYEISIDPELLQKYVRLEALILNNKYKNPLWIS